MLKPTAEPLNFANYSLSNAMHEHSSPAAFYMSLIVVFERIKCTWMQIHESACTVSESVMWHVCRNTCNIILTTACGQWNKLWYLDSKWYAYFRAPVLPVFQCKSFIASYHSRLQLTLQIRDLGRGLKRVFIQRNARSVRNATDVTDVKRLTLRNYSLTHPATEAMDVTQWTQLTERTQRPMRQATAPLILRRL